MNKEEELEQVALQLREMSRCMRRLVGQLEYIGWDMVKESEHESKILDAMKDMKSEASFGVCQILGI